MPLTGRPWVCPNCNEIIGRVIREQLVLKGEVRANTDGPCLVVVCPRCGNPKTWYPTMEACVGYLVSLMARQFLTELAGSVKAEDSMTHTGVSPTDSTTQTRPPATHTGVSP